MGGSRGPLEGFFEQPLRSYTLLGGPGIVREVLKRDLGHLGAVLGPSWGRLGAVLGPSWGRCGPVLGSLGLPLRVSGGFGGLYWGPLGITLGMLSRQTRLNQNIKKTQYVLRFWAPGTPKSGPSWGQVGF